MIEITLEQAGKITEEFAEELAEGKTPWN